MISFQNKSVTDFGYSVRFPYARVIHRERDNVPGVIFWHYQYLTRRYDNLVVLVRRDNIRRVFRNGEGRMGFGILYVFTYDGGGIIRRHGTGKT